MRSRLLGVAAAAVWLCAGTAWTHPGSGYRDTGDYDKAEADPPWQAHMELASAYAALGERDRAEAEFRTMLNLLEEHRTTAIFDAIRTGTLRADDPYERYIRFLVEADPPRIADALDVAERARARGFVEALASVQGAVAAKLPAALLAEEARIHRTIAAAQERLRAAAPATADRDRLIGELERAEQEREKFRLALRVEHPALAEARYPTLLDSASVQAALRPDEIAVAFFLAEPHSFRWTMSQEHVVVDRIAGRAAIEKEATRLRDLLRAPSAAAALTAASRLLGGMLFEGISTADDRPMVMVPHGVLHYVPFEVLTLQNRLVIERHAVSYAPSLNALVQLRRTAANTAPFRVLAVGHPTAATGTVAAERAGEVEQPSLPGPLPYAERELHAIGRTFRDRTRILSGASARESGLRNAEVPRYPVIHFATHGLVSDVEPKRSGLLLAPETGEDGLLELGEIYGLALKANLVVLSAGQTALGREMTGEGLVGLSRAFFYAGARAVVATLWNTSGRFAAELVPRFYRELNEGSSSEEALRRAKIAYVNHPQYSHPFYWSSLVLLGDGTRRLVPEPVTPPFGHLAPGHRALAGGGPCRLEGMCPPPDPVNPPPCRKVTDRAGTGRRSRGFAPHGAGAEIANSGRNVYKCHQKSYLPAPSMCLRDWVYIPRRLSRSPR